MQLAPGSARSAARHGGLPAGQWWQTLTATVLRRAELEHSSGTARRSPAAKAALLGLRSAHANARQWGALQTALASQI